MRSSHYWAGLLTVALVASHAFAKDDSCEKLLRGPAPAYILAYGAAPTAIEARIQFGFESEYTLDEVGGLLRYYAPVFTDAKAAAAWNQLTSDGQAAWVREQYKNRPEFATDTALRRISDDPVQAFLPEKLILDATGNLEIVLPPVDTLSDWQRQVEWINANVGVGSMQAMLSSPKVYFYGSKVGLSPERALKQNLGWLTFTADLDALTKLEGGAARYAKDPTKEVARSFAHPWLGPLTRQKQRRLEEFLGANGQGQGFDKDTLKFLKSDASFKYIGGSAYRPDIAGPDRIGIELRSAHKDYALLLGQVQRDTQALASDRSAYEKLAGVTAYDSQTDFAKFSPAVQTMLKGLFPSRADRRFDYTDEEKLALEVFRNFAYPLRAWSQYLDAMAAPDSTRRAVLLAQGAYVNRLVDIEARLTSGAITAADAGVQVQGALVQFASASGLPALFRAWLAQAQMPPQAALAG